MNRAINIQEVIDQAKLTPMHWRVLFWCTMIILFDGYDLVIYGVVLPRLMDAWQIDSVTAGYIGSAALVGMMFGAAILGSLADKFGRKRMIIICIFIFSFFTVVNGFARNATEFAVLRFIAGLGIGGVMPNAVALMSEYAPKKIRSTIVAIMFSGYAVGGMISASLGIWVVPNLGWQAMFFIAGIPLIALPFIIRYLPDSLAFLLKRGETDKVRHIVQKLEPRQQFAPDADLVLEIDNKGKAPLIELYREKRALSTTMFCTCFFMSLLMSYGLGSWLPKLMTMAGYGFSNSLMFLFALNGGAILGAVSGGWLADRFHLKPVLSVFFLLGAGALVMLGYPNPQPVLYILVTIAGAASIGASILLYAYVAQYYPTMMRSTGIGWASSVGRMGAIVGPIMGGFLLKMQLSHQLNFLSFAIPALIAAVAVLIVQSRYQHGYQGNMNKQAVLEGQK